MNRISNSNVDAAVSRLALPTILDHIKAASHPQPHLLGWALGFILIFFAVFTTKALDCFDETTWNLTCGAEEDEDGCPTCPPGGGGGPPGGGPPGSGPGGGPPSFGPGGGPPGFGPGGGPPSWSAGFGSGGGSEANCCQSEARGMARWRVEEPFVSLRIEDEPLFYSTAQGRTRGLRLFYVQRGFAQTLQPSTNVFGFGSKWGASCRKFFEVTGGPGTGGHFVTHSGDTTVGIDSWDKRTKMHFKWFDDDSGYRVTYPSGAVELYTNRYDVAYFGGSVPLFMLSTRFDSRSNHTDYAYTFSNNAILLNSVTDPFGRVMTFQYTNAALPSRVTSASVNGGGTSRFYYDSNSGSDNFGNVTNIVDMAGLSSFLQYDTGAASGYVTNLTTPYGATSFRIGGAYPTTENIHVPLADLKKVIRFIEVTEPGNRQQLFVYRSDSTKANNQVGAPDFLPWEGYPTNRVPQLTNAFFSVAHELDNTYQGYMNSFQWAPAQYAYLSSAYKNSGDPEQLTLSDYRYAHRRHWAGYVNTGDTNIHPRKVLNLEQRPSLDGSTEGPIVWYDYVRGTSSFAPESNNVPSLTATILPSGETWFVGEHRNTRDHVTNRFETWNDAAGNLKLRTNTFVYTSDDLGLLRGTNYDGTLGFAYEVNSHRQVVRSTNALGEVTGYTRDGASQLITSVKTPGGLTTTNLFDGNGLLTNSIDLEINRANVFTYTDGLLRTHTDERGLSVTNLWDSLNRLVSTHSPEGFTSNRYVNLDLFGTRDRLGNWTYFAHDGLQRRIVETNALGAVITFSYCSCGGLASMTDALTNTTTYSYDSRGQRVLVQYPDSTTVTNVFDDARRRVRVRDLSGNWMTNIYNNQGLLVTSSNALGQITRLLYDLEDRETNRVDANEVTISTSYDALDRPLTRTYPDGGIEKFAYSSRGLIAHTNGLTNVTRYFYDEAGRMTLETNANTEITQLKYDVTGNLTNLIDGKSQNTYWQYDQFSRMTNKLDHLKTNIVSYRYDANSHLTIRWMPVPTNGYTHYTYDSAGNLTTVDYTNSAGIDVTLGYDALNRLTNMVDNIGTSRYAYDSIGQLLSEDGPWENDTVSYTYANRLRTGLSLLQANASAWAASYAYDSARRTTNVSSPAGVFGYSYHSGAGTIAAPSSLIKRLSLPNGSAITNAFDSSGRLIATHLRSSGGTLLNRHDYTVNMGHQRTKQTRTDGSYMDYTYDPIGQVATALGSESGGTTNRWNERFRYSYDAAGNLSNRVDNVLTNVFVVNNLNELTTVVRTNASFTVAGVTTTNASSVTVADNGNSPIAATCYADNTFVRTNVTLVNGTNIFTAVAQDGSGRGDTNTASLYLPVATIFAYDLNGNLITNGMMVMAYDNENQLTNLTVVNAWMSEFRYDAKMRRRVRKEYTWNAGAWQQTNEVHYVYDANLVIQERDNFNLPTLSYTRGLDLSGTLQGAGGIGGLLALSNLKSLSPEHSYYHADGNGNVTCLIATNQSVVARYLYDPFGNTVAASGPAAELNLYRFSSKEWHLPAGLNYYLFRYYDPNLQRWPNRDPIGEDGGFNLYSFVQSDPINGRDMFGLTSGILGLPALVGSGLTATEIADLLGLTIAVVEAALAADIAAAKCKRRKDIEICKEGCYATYDGEDGDFCRSLATPYQRNFCWRQAFKRYRNCIVDCQK